MKKSIACLVSLLALSASAADKPATEGATPGQWTMDFEAARKVAVEKKLPILINFTGSVSPLAQPNHTYDVTATGGFQYQTDLSGNPTINVAEFGSESTDPVQPQLFRIKKTSTAPEGETATGPNFSHSYTVSIAVAPGQTVTDMLLSDVLPNNVQFVSVTTVSGHGTTTITPVSTPTTSTPGS